MTERSTTVYLQFTKGHYPGDARLARATTRKPDPPVPGAVVVKLKVRLPSAAFEPIEPEAELVVPESLIQRPVLVTAEAPE